MTKGIYQCPTEARHPGDIVGCGFIFGATPDKEGLVDCPSCGMWFRAEDSPAAPHRPHEAELLDTGAELERAERHERDNERDRRRVAE